MKKFLILLIIFFIVNCTLKIDNCQSQWYQINLPISGTIQQIQFINSNTGWAIIEQSTWIYSLIRTTNQGTNWFVIYSDSAKVMSIQFINDTLGYAGGYAHSNLILKTINSGL